MTGALIILGVLVAVGVVLYINHRLHPAPEGEAAAPTQAPDECCGQHAVCEKDSLMLIDNKIEYYDDEELDRFKGRDPESYTPAEENEIRDVMLTLRPEEVAPWYRSLALRGIGLSPALRDEMILLVTENRNS